MQRWRNVRGSQEAQASGREWRVRFYKRHGFLEQTCPTHLLSAVHILLRTSAAERLANIRPIHCCKNLNLDNCSLVCSTHVAQRRAQSLYCNIAQLEPPLTRHLRGHIASLHDGIPVFCLRRLTHLRVLLTHTFLWPPPVLPHEGGL